MANERGTRVANIICWPFGFFFAGWGDRKQLKRVRERQGEVLRDGARTSERETERGVEGVGM